MKFEHVALNVPDVLAAVAWYRQHLGLVPVRSQAVAPYTTFLADDTGRTFLELYSNPATPYPDYASQHALTVHVAFTVQNAAAERTRLEAAGARFDVEVKPPDGSHLIMMRDPWGVPVQLCQRATLLP